jgi:hypothetical protein
MEQRQNEKEEMEARQEASRWEYDRKCRGREEEAARRQEREVDELKYPEAEGPERARIQKAKEELEEQRAERKAEKERNYHVR